MFVLASQPVNTAVMIWDIIALMRRHRIVA